LSFFVLFLCFSANVLSISTYRNIFASLIVASSSVTPLRHGDGLSPTGLSVSSSYAEDAPSSDII
jgi:hypothetical protein